ncbi:DNA-3-methyladenine glycosylase family protein [Herbiconiux liukaitaii]|uniref:DNA-3-methyladenine glycosylase family protein n=1 Tax=Herbiconiux liukaitaii TaxID=3342799 RepID=UPI0035B6D3D5
MIADTAAPALERLHESSRPLDLRATLGPLRRGPHDPCVRFDESGIWLTLRPPEAEHLTATLHISRATPVARGAVRVRAWGDGAEAALGTVPELLGEHDDWSDLDTSAFGPGGFELLGTALHRNPGLRLTRTGRVFDALAPAIIEQKITSQEAFRAWRILVTAHGDPAPGPAPASMRVPPTAERWRRIPSWEWHRAGVDPRRSATLVRASAVARGLERTAHLHRTHPQPGPEARRLLQTVRGVGPWTAAETAQRALGDPDAVSFGDFHVAATVTWALVGEKLDDDALAELLEPWAGHRQRIVRLVLATGVAPPRLGPRMTIQDHRGH